MNLVPRRLRIEKDVILRIHRILLGKGKILVSLGQEVTPEEIIGVGETPGGFMTINLSSSLQVQPKDVGKYLKRKLGDRIYKGELLAQKSSWLFKKAKVVTSPSDGILDFINEKSGEIRITPLPKKINLPAGVYGVVEDISKLSGVVAIRTQVARIYGVCGSGRARDGILQILTNRTDMTLKSSVTQKYQGNILVGGSLLPKNSIMAAISNGVNGIITGGINAKDYKGMAGGRLTFPKRLENDIGISILVCEGFGSQSLGEDIYEILKEYEGKFVTIDGNKTTVYLPSSSSSCMIKIRKTQAFNEVGNILSDDKELFELKIGQRVRVIGSSFSAEQGKIVAIDKSQTRLASGISGCLATIETRRRKIQMPIQNLELI